MNKNYIKLAILLFVCGLSYFAIISDVSAATLEVGAGRTYSTIQAAVNTASCGDTISIYPGTYTENVDIDNRQCSSSSKITISSGGTGAVIVSPLSQSSQTFWFHGTTDWWTIDGGNQMTINGGSSIGNSGAFRIANTSGGAVDGVEVKNIIFNGNNADYGIITLSGYDRILIEGNTFQGSYYRGVEGQGIQLTSGASAYRLTVFKNTFINPNYAGVEGSEQSYWLVEKNYIYRDTPGGRYLIQHRGGSNWTIRNNIFEVRAGGDLFATVFLRGNTTSGGSPIQNEIYMNNTFANTGGAISNSYGVVFLGWDPVQNSLFQNNLFLGNWNTASGIFQYGSGGTGANNTAINNIKTASDVNSPWGNPNGWTFTNNTVSAVNYQASGNKPSPYFKITASYNGSDSNNPPTDDFDGNLRATIPDIGAFEYISGAPDTTPPSAPTGLAVN